MMVMRVGSKPWRLLCQDQHQYSAKIQGLEQKLCLSEGKGNVKERVYLFIDFCQISQGLL
jgi:hypothetical protein